MHGINPLDWSAAAYLGFHAIAFVAAILLGVLIQDGMRPEGRPGVLHGAEDRALLAGGPIRFMQAVAAALLADGQLVLADRGMLMRSGPATGGRTQAERAMLGNAGPFDIARVRKVMKEPAVQLMRDLRSRGLLMEPGEARQVRFTQSAPLFMLLLFGAERLRLGLVRGEAIGFLLLFEGVTLFALVLRFKALDQSTRQARAEIAAERVRNERLRRAPRGTEMATAVALFGTSVLAGTALDPFHRLFANSSLGGCGSSDGGDGGCGGGGCGGCGD